MKLQRFERILAVLCMVSVLTAVGYYIKDGFKVYDIKISCNDDNSEKISVNIYGEVENPGTYKVPENSRVCEVIYAAGGITENADISSVDLNAVVTDGFSLEIPPYGEENISMIPVVNINTADKNTLLLVPGIGSVTADRIIEYRQKNGKFEKIEDITRVRGIGEKTFIKIKDYIKTEEQP